MPFSKKGRQDIICSIFKKKKQTTRVLETFPHDSTFFTQGLYYEDPYIYESSGGYGKSLLTKYILKTGEIVNQTKLPDNVFAEGITVVGDTILLLTWRSRTGWIFDKHTLLVIKQFSYPMYEGWGMTYDGTNLIISDGSHALMYINSETFELEKTLQVKWAGRLIDNINELSFSDNRIYANIWKQPIIIEINNTTGNVENIVDLVNLTNQNSKYGVLNGNTWVSRSNGKQNLLVTGKNWPELYLLEY